MNKDVIYIEPEDDITDIITKIENSKQKIVALVPPKKAGVFRSVVNIKLISKAGAAAKKTVVLVTTDPSIIKLAGATKLPVTKDLNSAPAVPNIKADLDETTKEEVTEKDEEKEEKEEADDEAEDDEASDDDSNDEEAEEKEPNSKKLEKGAKKLKKEVEKHGNKVIGWMRDHKKLVAFCSIFVVLLIILLIWMFAIAPAVDIFVSIKTNANNFSESVTFTKTLTEENIEEGKFYLEEKRIEEVSETEFEATGTKNVGDKAAGSVVVYAYFKQKGTVAINAGSIFTISDLGYTSTNEASLSWDQKSTSVCDNKNDASLVVSGCLISARIDVVATAPGSNYNIAASSNGWSTTANVGVYSDSAMTGGTDLTIKVVSQEDIDKAKNEINSSSEAENKEKLYETIGDDSLIINSSFRQTTSDGESTPAVGEEVKEGEKATLKITTTTLVFVIDKTKVEEFIREKAKLGENQKIFEIRNAYIDGFKELEGGFAGKIKAVYFTGPRITETELVDKIKGKGIGDARREIKDINGVSEVKMEPAYPFVTSVPNDSNRISISFEIKDQDGNTIEDKGVMPDENTKKTEEEEEETE